MSVTYEGINSDLMRMLFKRAAILVKLERLNAESGSNLKFIESELTKSEKVNDVILLS